MQVQIVSKGIDVSQALRERIEGRLDEMMDKYIHRDGDANVSMSREGSGFRGVVAVNLPSGASFQSQGNAPDAYAAADEALTHIEKRLRRYKRRLKDHKHEDRAETFAMTILENPIRDVVDSDNEDDDTPLGNSDAMVIAQSHGKVRKLTPGMAALECAMADSGVVIFRNAKHGRVNVVFKRPDGNIGWVDPES